MSVYTPKENHFVKQPGLLHQFDSRNQEVSEFEGFHSEIKYFEGIESMEKAVSSCDSLNPADQVSSDNIDGLPEVLTKYYEQGRKSLDNQLTSQILSSIRNKLASSMHHETSEEQNVSELTIIKKEIPEDFVNYHDEFNVEASYSQTLQSFHPDPVDHFSTSTFESHTSNASPDSSVNPSHTSSASTSPKGMVQFGIVDTDFSQSEHGDSCDSTQPTTGPRGARCKQVSKQTNLLPPCRVCGDKASGFHYGANTCEACKGFFRRSLKKDRLDFKCNGSNNCEIQKGRRNNCPMCRYNRCLNAGMSKQAIKTGRYTHEKRTQDIVEVKTLNGELGPHLLQPSFIKVENSPKSAVKKTLTAENRQLLDYIYSAHKQIFPFWHQVLDSGSHHIKSRKYAEQYKKKTSLKSDTSSLVSQECNNFKHDSMVEEEEGRKQTIDTVTKHIEISIMAFVRYAKSIPGFTDLSLNDQAALVKLSRFEIWMIGAHKFMNYDLKVVSGPRGNSYHMEELAEIMDKDFVRSLFNFAQSMQDIKLTNEETALMKCVALTFADRSQLQEPERVEVIQQRLTECLEELLGDGQRFAKVMNALIRLRDLTEWNKTISENMVLEWPNMKQHPLLLEIMSV